MPGLFGMSAIADGDKFAAAREAMLAEIEKIKSLSVSAHEVQKAVKQFISATLAARKTMEGQAQNLGGNWLAANDLNFSERYLAAVKRVSHADVQRVAREYLTAENRTLYALLPDGTAPKPKAEVETNTDQPIQKFEILVGRASSRAEIVQTSGSSGASPHQINGLRLLVKEDHRLPFVEFRAVFQGGVLAETAENNGATMLLAKMLLKGTKTRSAEKIATEIESVGGSIDSYGGNNSFGVNAEVLSSDFATGLDLLADVLLNPTFPANELEREREVQIASIHARKDDLLKSASFAMRQAIVRQHRLWPRFARHGGNGAKSFRRRPEDLSPKTHRAEQLRAGDLRRREVGRRESRRGKSVCELEKFWWGERPREPARQ